MTRRSANACVIGGGIIGSWAALHLAERGIPTTLLEQYPLPHDKGSSHGATRAFRFLGDDPQDRLEYSLDRWHALEAATRQCLFRKTGLLNFGPPGDAYLEKHMAVLRQAGRPVEWLEHSTIAEWFPQIRYPATWGAAWDPNGGILFADRCLAAVRQQFLALGGRVVTARAESIDADSSGAAIRVTADSNGGPAIHRFDRVVICAGPWTSQLVSELEPFLDSLLIPVTYWRDPSGACRADDGFPILFNARHTGIYGLPACEEHGHVKILYHGGPSSDPDARNLESLQPYIDKVAAYVEQYLPELDHQKPAILETCRYTMTPDNEPIIDRLDDGLVVGCGFSGSGFKHAPATGQMLTALALGEESKLPRGFWQAPYALTRFPG